MPSPQSTLFLDPPPTLGLLYAPLDLGLAAPRSTGPRAKRSRGRSMQAQILRPIDLRATHGFNVTGQRLAQIVESYDPINIEAATLNFDHTQQGPSHGLASKLWFEGDIVVGQWDDLSEEAVAALESERWSRRSAEINLQHDATGGWYLTGLALLGAKPPAVFGLAPAMLLSRQPYRLQLDAGGKENPMPPETANPATPEAPAPTAAADDVLPPTAQEGEEAEETEATPATPAELEEEEAAAAQSLAGETPSPIVMVDPPATPADAPAAATLSADSGAAAESMRLSAENAALSARLTAVNRTVLLHQVQAELAACRGVSPGVLRTGVAEALVELRLMENKQPLIALLSTATADGKVKAVPIADIFLAAFAALPPIAALEATPLATRDADPAENGDHRTAAERQAHLRAGLSDESYLQLSRKYGFNQPVN